jgi:hypothetical protein
MTGMRHMNATVAYVYTIIKGLQFEGKPQDYVTRDGEPVSYEEALEHLEQMQRDGFKFIPCCDNFDKERGCMGSKATNA